MGAHDLKDLQLNVGRWGNSLAVRLPAELAHALDLSVGSILQVERQADNSLRVSARSGRKPLSKADWLKRAHAHLAKMPRTKSVIREMRDDARY